ncbi:MAG TPA: hypothetical protein VFM18_09790 [Methanosarcina sp.]|nr:hypothetical protein [Methanosarcina sp.]
MISDPFIASAIIGVATIGGGVAGGPMGAMAGASISTSLVGMSQAAKAQQDQQDAQKQLFDNQERARVANVQNEIGLAAQRTNMALTNAATRNNGSKAPSFAGNSFLGLGDGSGGVSSSSGQAKTMGSSGTF